LFGFAVDAVPSAGAAVFAGDASVGELTRSCHSPDRDEPIAFGLLDTDVASGDDALTVQIDGEPVAAERLTLPVVEGSDTSARLPSY
jgi:aminomethyltransferase